MTRIVSAVAVVLVAGAAPMAAQDVTSLAMATERDEPTDRARELFEQAKRLTVTPSDWRKAAKLFEQSASLRPADDTGAYECLLMAGRVYSALDEYGKAQASLQKAAEHALARGAVLDAANAYIYAAHAAVRDGNASVAAQMRDSAVLLANAPSLSAADRSAILERTGA